MPRLLEIQLRYHNSKDSKSEEQEKILCLLTQTKLRITNYKLRITVVNHKNLCKGTEKNTNSLLGITIFKDFKFRERELFWSLRSLGFPENYSRWPENLFQKNLIIKRKDAKTQSFILNTESTKDTKKIIKS